MKPELLIEEARRTRQLLSKLDGELRKGRRGRRISGDTWSEIIVQAVMLDAAIATTETLIKWEETTNDK